MSYSTGIGRSGVRIKLYNIGSPGKGLDGYAWLEVRMHHGCDAAMVMGVTRPRS